MAIWGDVGSDWLISLGSSSSGSHYVAGHFAKDAGEPTQHVGTEASIYSYAQRWTYSTPFTWWLLGSQVITDDPVSSPGYAMGVAIYLNGSLFWSRRGFSNEPYGYGFGWPYRSPRVFLTPGDELIVVNEFYSDFDLDYVGQHMYLGTNYMAIEHVPDEDWIVVHPHRENSETPRFNIGFPDYAGDVDVHLDWGDGSSEDVVWSPSDMDIDWLPYRPDLSPGYDTGDVWWTKVVSHTYDVDSVNGDPPFVVTATAGDYPAVGRVSGNGYAVTPGPRAAHGSSFDYTVQIPTSKNGVDDDFNRDSSLLLTRPDGGFWSNPDNTWIINGNNEAYRTTYGIGSICNNWLATDYGYDETVTISLDIRQPGPYQFQRIFFGMQSVTGVDAPWNPGNGYQISIMQLENWLALSREGESGAQVWGTSFAGPSWEDGGATQHTMVITLNYTTRRITMSFDGVPWIDYTDPLTTRPIGSVLGLFADSRAGQTFDNVSVTGTGGPFTGDGDFHLKLTEFTGPVSNEVGSVIDNTNVVGTPHEYLVPWGTTSQVFDMGTAVSNATHIVISGAPSDSSIVQAVFPVIHRTWNEKTFSVVAAKTVTEVSTPYGADSIMWVRADSPTNPVPADGTVINYWFDENGRALRSNSVGGGGYPPITYQSNRQKHLPGLVFPVGSNALGFAALAELHIPNIHAFVIAKTAYANNSGFPIDIFSEQDGIVARFVGGISSSNYDYSEFALSASASQSLYSYAYVEPTSQDEDEEGQAFVTGVTNMVPRLYEAGRLSTGALTMRVDDTTATSWDYRRYIPGPDIIHTGPVPITPLGAQGWYVGNFTGDIYEIVVVAGDGNGDWDGVLLPSKQAQIRCALARKWGIRLKSCGIPGNLHTGRGAGGVIFE
jgi:hypothetical protein